MPSNHSCSVSSTSLANACNDTTPRALDPNAVNGFNAEFFRSASVQSFSQAWGGEVNLRYKWHCGPNYWIDILGGYRHFNLAEGITITEDSWSRAYTLCLCVCILVAAVAGSISGMHG